MADALETLGLKTDRNIAVTGCRSYANENKEGPKVVVMGELDSVVCPEHPDCDKNTGAIHACGHNIQTTVMYGVADALVHSGILEQLDGKIDFMAVPAEEYIEMDYRQKLKDEGKLNYFAGKVELISKGAFDDVDMCMMVHNFPLAEEGINWLPVILEMDLLERIPVFWENSLMQALHPGMDQCIKYGQSGNDGYGLSS